MDMTQGQLLRRGDYVYGSFFKPESVDGYINGMNPGDRDDVLGRFPFSSSSVEEAIEYAALGVRSWRRLGFSDRAAAVKRFRDNLGRYQEDTARLITRRPASRSGRPGRRSWPPCGPSTSSWRRPRISSPPA